MANSRKKILIQNNNSQESSVVYKPLVINLEKSKDRKILNDLFRRRKVWNVVEETTEQQKELHYVKNPRLLNSRQKNNDDFGQLENKYGRWIYYPWSGQLVHVLKPDSFKKVRLSRNDNLIDKLEQKEYEKINVAFAGLNIGNPAAIAIALEGGSTNMKFADNDILTLSNLNRFRASLHDLGVNKAILSARQVYEINPFANITVFDQGLTQKNIEHFLLKPRVDVLVEETDELSLKISIRKFAKKFRIPVIMVTGNAENVILDVERYDKDPKLKILNGKLSLKVQTDIEKNLHTRSLSDFAELCQDFIGRRYISRDLQSAFRLVGKDLVGIPQLAECSFLRGAVISFAVRMIALKKLMPSGRYNIRLDNII